MARFIYGDGASVSNLTSTNNGTFALYAVWTNEFTIDTDEIDDHETITVEYNNNTYPLDDSSPDLVLEIASGDVKFTASDDRSDRIFNGWSSPDEWGRHEKPYNDHALGRSYVFSGC